jgi:hypothetical protein
MASDAQTWEFVDSRQGPATLGSQINVQLLKKDCYREGPHWLYTCSPLRGAIQQHGCGPERGGSGRVCE